MGGSSKSRIEVAVYDGSLIPEDVIDWINAMKNHFDYEETPTRKKVKFAVTRLKGHALLWWDGV